MATDKKLLKCSSERYSLDLTSCVSASSACLLFTTCFLPHTPSSFNRCVTAPFLPRYEAFTAAKKLEI